MVINPIVGVYIPIKTIPIKGEMTIPNIGSLDPGTYTLTSVRFFSFFESITCGPISHKIPWGFGEYLSIYIRMVDCSMIFM